MHTYKYTHAYVYIKKTVKEKSENGAALVLGNKKGSCKVTVNQSLDTPTTKPLNWAIDMLKLRCKLTFELLLTVTLCIMDPVSSKLPRD